MSATSDLSLSHWKSGELDLQAAHGLSPRCNTLRCKQNVHNEDRDARVLDLLDVIGDLEQTGVGDASDLDGLGKGQVEDVASPEAESDGSKLLDALLAQTLHDALDSGHGHFRTVPADPFAELIRRTASLSACRRDEEDRRKALAYVEVRVAQVIRSDWVTVAGAVEHHQYQQYYRHYSKASFS